MPEASILVVGKDQLSPAVSTMRNSIGHLNKDADKLRERIGELQKNFDSLSKKKHTIKLDLDKAKSDLKEAKKRFIETGEAADKLTFEEAAKNYENINHKLKNVSKSARKAGKDLDSLTNSSRKAENRAGGGMSSSLRNLSKTMAASGASAFLGNTAGQVANAYVGSAYGSASGNVFSGGLSGAGMGAAIGSAIAPGVGTAIGAALGGAVGVVQGVVQNEQEKDESFKSYYQDLYTKVTEEQKTMLSQGSEIAASRETQKMSFTTMLGSEEAASEYLGKVRSMDAVTPFSYDDLTSMSKTLMTYFDKDAILPLLTKVGDTGAALGMNTYDMSRVAESLGRMHSSGKATLEYLNPLIERGIPVWDYLVKATGKTKEEVQDMVSTGLIPGQEAAKILADEMGEANEGAMELQSGTYSGLLGQLEAANDELANAMGEGYNTMRKPGMQDEVDWLTGESGTEMQEAYRQLGEAKGALENLQNQMMNEAMQSVMSGEITDSFADSDQLGRLKELAQEYKDAQAEIEEALESGDDTALEEAKFARGRALAEAKVIGYNEYNASEGAQAELDSMLTLAENIKNDSALKDSYHNAGYRMGQQFSEGLKSAVRNTSPSDIITPSREHRSQGLSGGKSYKPKAFGMSFVPYDNFPAMLHYGESVLTASENRNYRKGGGAPVSFAGAAFYVREEADVDKIANRIVEKMIRAQELSV